MAADTVATAAFDTFSIGLFIIGIVVTGFLHHFYTGKLIESMNRTTERLVERINYTTHEISKITLAGLLAINIASREDREFTPKDFIWATETADEMIAEIAKKREN